MFNKPILQKIILGILVLILLYFIAGWVFERIYRSRQIKYGVSFSPNYAKYLNLDWQKMYLQILDDLKVRNLRLPTFWDTIERDPQKDDFSEVDFMLTEAGKRGAGVVLVVGVRQPRWPECHIPEWAKILNVGERQQKTREFVQKVVTRYKDNKVIQAWQVENEPLVGWFGQHCDPPDKQFLQKEVELVKYLDPKRPIIITDTGEWSFWASAMKSSDILGVSLYRKAHNPALGDITYPFASFIYPLRSDLIRKIFAPNNQKTIIAELQAEPWTKNAIPDTSLEEQVRLFSVKDFQNNLAYARKTGFDEAFLWGVEWWYYMAQKGYPRYLELAKTLFR